MRSEGECFTSDVIICSFHLSKQKGYGKLSNIWNLYFTRTFSLSFPCLLDKLYWIICDDDEGSIFDGVALKC